VEPNQRLLTSSKGLSLAGEVKAPGFINYGSGTLFLNHEHGRVKLENFPKNREAEPLLKTNSTSRAAKTIVRPLERLKAKKFVKLANEDFNL